ncbi:hypothetical protein D3C74_379830 [compost metagenome]
MEVSGTGQERCFLIIRKSNKKESISVNPQVGGIVRCHCTACHMQGIHRTDTYSQADLFSIHPALSAIHRCRNTGYSLAHNVFEHYTAGFETDRIYVGDVVADNIQLCLETAHA